MRRNVIARNNCFKPKNTSGKIVGIQMVCLLTDGCMASNFTDLKNKTMTKADLIEVLDKYDSDFNLETGETIQAIYFYDFGKLADELVKLFAIHNVMQQRELLIAYEKTVGAMDINEVEKEVDKYLKNKGN